ncbi:MAG: xanthine dehydrogenase family protein molybdopterin-binding subunit, partial [Methylobacterium sp.]|nr:xanthine dehydrogenase family protein molybdopterin-binding subunit [Methylobacterium sp.]
PAVPQYEPYRPAAATPPPAYQPPPSAPAAPAPAAPVAGPASLHGAHRFSSVFGTRRR